MGSHHFYGNKNPFQYGIFKDEESKKGETKILRSPFNINKELPISTKKNLNTLIDAFEYNLKNNPEKKFIGTRQHIKGEKYDNYYNWKTFKEANELIYQFIFAIEKLNFCPEIQYENQINKLFGIYSKNREEWIISYLGCQLNSITVVTLYDTLGVNAIEFILNQTELISVLIESNVLEKICKLKIENKLGKLKNLIIASNKEENEEIIEKNIEKCKELGFIVYKYEDFLKLGKENLNDEKIRNSLKKSTPETYTTFCYTSGTTGNPKGAMIKNRSLLNSVYAVDPIGRTVKNTDIYYSFLPLAHIMEQIIFAAVLYYSAQYGFYSGNPKRIIQDCQILHPTFFCCVPRILTRIYDEINKKISLMKYPLKNIIQEAIKQKLKNYENYGILTHILYDKLIFSKFRNILGGNLEWILVGSAPMEKNIINFLRIAFSIPITEGYGQTEDCAGVLLANVNDTSCGHLGGINTPCELKLIDVPDLDYYSNNYNEETKLIEPKGEICIRGILVFDGYYKEIEKTKEILDEDGWLHSGDIGVILTNHGNAVKVIDRVKNIFKLSQGEYIAPEKIQNLLGESKYISQVYIHGESLFSFLVAVVVPEKSECEKFLNSIGVSCNGNVEKYFDNVLLKKQILKDMEEIGKKNDLKGFEMVKQIYITSEPFTIENNLLTPTLKIKSNEVRKKYAKEIAEMYRII